MQRCDEYDVHNRQQQQEQWNPNTRISSTIETTTKKKERKNPNRKK